MFIIPIEPILLKAVYEVVPLVLGNCAIRSASKFVTPELVVTATRRHKPYRRQKTVEIVLTIGKPNFRGREFVKKCIKSGEPFPVKKVQLKFIKKK